jgi:hypothetical protein
MASLVVVGLDTASNRWHLASRGLAPGFVVAHHKAKGTLDARRQELCETFERSLVGITQLALMRDLGSVHVFAEEPLALQNGKTTRALGLAAGALWAQHLKFDVWWHWVDVQTWQAMCGVKAADRTAERKAKVREFIWTLTNGSDPNYVDWDEDHYDAAGLAIYGERELEKLPDLWREVAHG